MALSAETLSSMFPLDTPNFTPPFAVNVDAHGAVHIEDAEDAIVATFCDVTQMPLGDEKALAAEVAYWTAEAQRIAAALNIAYPKKH